VVVAVRQTGVYKPTRSSLREADVYIHVRGGMASSEALGVDSTYVVLAMRNVSSSDATAPRPILWSPYVIGQTIYIFIQSFVMAALRSRCGHFIFDLWLLSSSSFLFLA